MCLVKLNAQDLLPPVYEISSDTISYELLPDSCLQILADKTGKWTIEQVSVPPLSNGFHAYQGIVNYSIQTHWLRYRLHNRMKTEINIGVHDAKNDLMLENQRSD